MRKCLIPEEAEKDLMNLEKFYYEEGTKRRLVSMAMSMDFENTTSVIMSKYYNNYLNSYIQYDKAKNAFYQKYIQNLEKNTDKSWKIDFNEKCIIFYD